VVFYLGVLPMLIDMDALGKGDMIGLAAVVALTLALALIPYVVVAD
jgi:threonine/homoserine/homoserine lactone efflux protein